MKNYVLDANAVLRYFKISHAEGGELVRNLFLEAQRKQASLCISVVNTGEVYYQLLKSAGEQMALHYIRALQHSVTIIEADLESATNAATLKHRYNLGYADSFAAALALSLKATLVSADPDFEKVGKSLKWMRLPPYKPKNR